MHLYFFFDWGEGGGGGGGPAYINTCNDHQKSFTSGEYVVYLLAANINIDLYLASVYTLQDNKTAYSLQQRLITELFTLSRIH